MSSLKKSVTNGFLWKFAERLSSQGITFLLSILLARLLSPEEYGTIAMINIFIALSNVFISNGFASSLIQNKDAKDIDFSTNLYLSLFVSLILYFIIFLIAPYFADFYDNSDLCVLIRVYCLSLFLLSYNSIQNAWVSRHMIFKKIFYATLSGSIGSGLIGLYMAYNGWGVWSLVAQYLSNIIINMIVMISIVPWKPYLSFSWDRGKTMFKYGSNLIASGLLGTGFNQLRQLIVGKVFSPSDLGLFNRAHQFPNLIYSNIENSLAQVLFPAISNFSDNSEKVKQMTRNSIKTSSYILFFFLTLLAAVAQPMVEILLNERWVACVPFLQIMCLEAMLNSVSTVNLQTIKAMGRSDLLFKMELKKKPVFFLLLLVSSKISILAVVICMPLYAIYANFVNMAPNRYLLNYKIKEQLVDYKTATILSLIMFLIVYPISFLEINNIMKILVQTILGITVYLGLSYFYKVDSYNYLLDILKEKKK